MSDHGDVGGSPQGLAGGRRVARPQAPVAPAVILADVSFSMGDQDGLVLGRKTGGLVETPRRIDRLALVLDYLLKRVRVRSLICFSDLPVEVPLVGRVVLPEPAGSTALHVALEYVAGLDPLPSQLFVLSDGMPNDVDLALHCGRLLRPMTIHAYYIGPEEDQFRLGFMRDLAACGGPGGRSGHFDMLDPVLLGSELHKQLLLGRSGS